MSGKRIYPYEFIDEIGGFRYAITPDELAWILDQMDRHEDAVDPGWWELRLWLIRN
ncbi:hypothetical protein LCGC14_2699070 [marine sediment metagenome]|uniref:Uncharacterized protein n=1 Tax=marine sediment metagenome TaxID=412755 RepID=A0A0F9C836_9ZZZZ